MSMVTRKLFTLGKRLAIGLVVGLLAQQALGGRGARRLRYSAFSASGVELSKSSAPRIGDLHPLR